jgi:nucleoid-associated protein YgaU
MRYTARPGDTVTALAEAFFGAGTPAAREAVTGANPSLGTNPNHLTVGTTYRIVTPSGLSAAAAPAAAAAIPASRRGPQPDADDVLRDGSGRTLRYTARAGDTVTNLAVALLGSDTKANREAILNANAALKADPDRVVVGQTYWIPAPVARTAAGE